MTKQSGDKATRTSFGASRGTTLPNFAIKWKGETEKSYGIWLMSTLSRLIGDPFRTETRMSRQRDCNSRTKTLNASGLPSGLDLLLNIPFKTSCLPRTSSDLLVNISCSM